MRRISIMAVVFLFILGGTARSSEQAQAALPDNIKAIITHHCSVPGCHQGRYPTGNLNLEPNKFLSSTLNAPSTEVPGTKIIDTSAPEKSYLLSKIKGEPGIAGARMPASRDPLSAEQVNAIQAWISSLKHDPPRAGGAGGEREGGRDIQPGRDRPAAVRKMTFNNPAFWGTRIINLPTAETIDRGTVLFRVSHRFIPAVSSGWDGFYGLDGPAFILLSFGYGITDRLMVTVGRTNHDQEWEFTAGYRLFDTFAGPSLPLSGALQVGGSLVSRDRPANEEWSGRLRFSALFSLASQVTDRISLLIVPAFASNTNYWQPDSEGTFSLGVGGRALVFDDFSVIAEWVPVLAGHKDYMNGWGVGVEKKIGGHVFQVFITNCYGLTAAQYIIGGELGQLATGFFDRFRLGFNIFRKF